MCDNNSTKIEIGEIKSYHSNALNPYMKLNNITWRYTMGKLKMYT